MAMLPACHAMTELPEARNALKRVGKVAFAKEDRMEGEAKDTAYTPNNSARQPLKQPLP